MYDFKISRKFFVWSEHYNKFGLCQLFGVALWEPQQNNVSNPEAYSEPCQTYMMQYAVYTKNSQWLKTLNFFS